LALPGCFCGLSTIKTKVFDPMPSVWGCLWVFKQLFALIFRCLGAVYEANSPAFWGVFGCVGMPGRWVGFFA